MFWRFCWIFVYFFGWTFDSLKRWLTSDAHFLFSLHSTPNLDLGLFSFVEFKCWDQQRWGKCYMMDCIFFFLLKIELVFPYYKPFFVLDFMILQAHFMLPLVAFFNFFFIFLLNVPIYLEWVYSSVCILFLVNSRNYSRVLLKNTFI